MKRENPPISLSEFQAVWMKCLSAMDRIIIEKGYNALTSENICGYTGLTEKIPILILATFKPYSKCMMM